MSPPQTVRSYIESVLEIGFEISAESKKKKELEKKEWVGMKPQLLYADMN